MIFTNDKYDKIWCAGINDKCQIPDYFPIKYFHREEIEIIQIHSTVSGATLFFKDDENNLYASRYMHENPIMIPYLRDVIDIQCGYEYSLVLSGSNINHKIRVVISYLSRAYHVKPNIMALCYNYSRNMAMNCIKLYGKLYPLSIKFAASANSLSVLDEQGIIKISSGGYHALFLTESGDIWVAGDNNHAQCGVYDPRQRRNNDSKAYEDVKRPTMLRWFTDGFNNVIKIRPRIIEIFAGVYHNLCIDECGRVYSWGHNYRGQCGHGHRNHVLNPKLIDALRYYVVDKIKCGFHSSYCRTRCGRHYLWGKNEDNHCLTYDDRVDVTIPFRVDNIIKKRCECDSIIDVIPGYDCTIITCE